MSAIDCHLGTCKRSRMLQAELKRAKQLVKEHRESAKFLEMSAEAYKSINRDLGLDLDAAKLELARARRIAGLVIFTQLLVHAAWWWL